MGFVTNLRSSLHLVTSAQDELDADAFLDDPERQNEDGSADLVRSAGTGEVEAKPLRVFHTWQQVDTFVAIWGAQYQPMKQLDGQNRSRRIYVCRHPQYSKHGNAYLKRKRSGVESSGGAASSSSSGHGTCDAFFCFQRVRAQLLLTGTWHRSQYSRMAYGGGGGDGGGDGGDDDGTDGASEAASDTTEPARPKEKSSSPGKRRSNSIQNHQYPVPKLKELPRGYAKSDRVIALTCFKAHVDHPSQVNPSDVGSSSTNTQNVPGSAGGLGQNNTCRCVCPFMHVTPLHVLPAFRARSCTINIHARCLTTSGAPCPQRNWLLYYPRGTTHPVAIGARPEWLRRSRILTWAPRAFQGRC